MLFVCRDLEIKLWKADLNTIHFSPGIIYTFLSMMNLILF